MSWFRHLYMERAKISHNSKWKPEKCFKKISTFSFETNLAKNFTNNCQFLWNTTCRDIWQLINLPLIPALWNLNIIDDVSQPIFHRFKSHMPDTKQAGLKLYKTAEAVKVRWGLHYSFLPFCRVKQIERLKFLSSSF